ncbi:hypothetical protein FGO68_gene16723 [Halteria grandinella]|uniref:Uncharacterized protein n=1 Tax=Halteria grandinella TaxID=5974 RepID=A0A8J8NBQ9_HALGN|nr:hypothetical protein FGO68_gene16723 [Halteria grandinella]
MTPQQYQQLEIKQPLFARDLTPNQELNDKQSVGGGTKEQRVRNTIEQPPLRLLRSRQINPTGNLWESILSFHAYCLSSKA